MLNQSESRKNAARTPSTFNIVNILITSLSSVFSVLLVFAPSLVEIQVRPPLKQSSRRWEHFEAYNTSTSVGEDCPMQAACPQGAVWRSQPPHPFECITMDRLSSEPAACVFHFSKQEKKGYGFLLNFDIKENCYEKWAIYNSNATKWRMKNITLPANMVSARR